MTLRFEPLSQDRLPEALKLIEVVFPDNLNEISEVYKASLEENKTHFYWNKNRVLEYWTAIDPKTNKIVALTGFYQSKEHSEGEIWLGWFCVDPSERGNGIGRKTIEWTIDEARNRGYKLFRLWTTTGFAEAAAQKLYESLGLKIYKTEPEKKTGNTVLYRELRLL